MAVRLLGHRAQTIALTGMVRHGDISGLAVKVYAESAFGDVAIDFYNPGTPQTGWNIASDQLASADDYVTYRIVNARVGRTQSQQLVGPMNVSWTGVEQFVSYHLVHTGGGTYAPLGSATPWSRVYVTNYQLPAPTFVATGNPNEYRVTLQGAAESVGNAASQQELVELWQDMLGPNVLVTSAMATLNTNQGVWNRLLLGYSVDVFIVVADPNTPIYVFQYQPRSGESSDNAQLP